MQIFGYITYSGRQRHGSTISRIAAISTHEYYLHLISILSLMHMHVIAFQWTMFCIAASSYQASDQFAEQKMIFFDSMKRLIRMFNTSASQILLEEVDLIACT